MVIQFPTAEQRQEKRRGTKGETPDHTCDPWAHFLTPWHRQYLARIFQERGDEPPRWCE